MGSRTHVVILNWNGRRYVHDCLDSIFAQTYEEADVLVVDNGSTDGSAEFIRDEFPEAVLIALPANLHFARGTNAGVEVALQDSACEFVVTLNNDTRSDPEFLAGLVKAAAEERVGMVAAKLLFMDRPTILNTTGICPTRDGSGVDRGWNQRDDGQFDRETDVFAPTAGGALFCPTLFQRGGPFGRGFVAYYQGPGPPRRGRPSGLGARVLPP